MADQSQSLKIVLQLQADVAAGVAATKAGLQEIQVQATETARVVNSVGQTTVAVNPANAQYIAESEARLATMMAAQEKSAVNEALINAQMERRVIIETQLEAAEARIAGNPALAVKLEREAAIRTQALTIQRALNITTEESIALAERQVLAQEASAVAANSMGINLAKAKTEAMVLGRELAAGNVRASTMSSLLGSLGSTITIAGIAGYELYQVISHAGDAALEAAKNSEQIEIGLRKAVDEWITMANHAQDFGDQIKLADKVQRELDKLALNMEKFRSEQISAWRKFWDAIAPTATLIASGLTGFKFPTPPNAQADAAERLAAAQAKYNKGVLDANIAHNKAAESLKTWADAEADLPNGLAIYTQKLNDAEAKLADLDAKRRANLTDPDALKAYEDQLREVQDLRDKTNQLGDELDENNRKAKKHSGLQKEITAELRDQANILAQIRANQQSVKQNPFLSDDQKNAALLPLVTQEAQALGAQLQRDQAEQAKLTDPGQWNRMQGAIIQAKAKLTELGFEAQKLTFVGGLRAELTSWANSFGTTAKQVASAITSTLGNAISGITQGITGLIFRTTTLKQAFQQTVQSIVQNILQIALQWAASRLLMSTLNRLFGAQDAAASNAQASGAAAAWAPAATSASIASYGAAAGAGLAAYLSALGIGVSSAVGLSATGSGFEVGGFTGGREGRAAGIVHGQEYVFSAPATRAIGVSFLDSLHTNAKRGGYASGGFVGNAPSSPASTAGAAPQIHFAVFDDPRKLAKWFEGREGQRIIYDTVNRRRIDLGI